MSRITLSGNASGTGNFTLASPNSSTDRTLTLPDATGTVVLANGSGNIATTSVTPSAGVYLGGSGSANLLDDYEEGTWTPTTGGSGVPVSSSNGFYTKVGQVVHIEGSITFGSTSNSSQCNVDGFPFAGASDTRGGFFIRYTDEGSFAFTMHMNASSTSCALYFTSGGSAAYSAFSGNRIDFVGSYRV
jgi:hypothetical protein